MHLSSGKSGTKLDILPWDQNCGAHLLKMYSKRIKHLYCKLVKYPRNGEIFGIVNSISLVCRRAAIKTALSCVVI